MYISLPQEPMAPIYDDHIPSGEEWGFQLKWDGVRILCEVTDNGVNLYSRKLLNKNNVFPEIVVLLHSIAASLGPCLLDGEVIYWDGDRPAFHKVLMREKSGGTAMISNSANSSGHFAYVIFDMLAEGDLDLRPLPFLQRHNCLNAKIKPFISKQLLLADLYSNGEALWQWVMDNNWGGIVSKRLDSSYRIGKKHKDWLKKKTSVVIQADVVGIKLREGKVASLVMSCNGMFAGSVSLGLNEAMKQLLAESYLMSNRGSSSTQIPFNKLPAELKGEHIFWLPVPLPCQATGLEITSAGLLRHPKLISFGH